MTATATSRVRSSQASSMAREGCASMMSSASPIPNTCRAGAGARSRANHAGASRPAL